SSPATTTPGRTGIPTGRRSARPWRWESPAPPWEVGCWRPSGGAQATSSHPSPSTSPPTPSASWRFAWHTPEGETGLPGPHHRDALSHSVTVAVLAAAPLGVPGDRERHRHRGRIRAGNAHQPPVAELREIG